MKRKQILAAILGAVTVVSTGCGTSDSLKSLTLSSSGASSGGFSNLVGVDGTLQLTVIAIYHSGKSVDVTNDSTFSVTTVGADDNGTPLPPYGPNTVPINKTGLMTGIVPICTWTDALDETKTPPAPANPPIWEYTGYYQVTGTYKNLTSQPIGIGVGVAASNNSPTGGCGPS